VEQGHATSRYDALFDGGLRGLDGILDAVLLLF
jgi:hypothetical protein